MKINNIRHLNFCLLCFAISCDIVATQENTDDELGGIDSAAAVVGGNDDDAEAIMDDDDDGYGYDDDYCEPQARLFYHAGAQVRVSVLRQSACDIPHD